MNKVIILLIAGFLVLGIGLVIFTSIPAKKLEPYYISSFPIHVIQVLPYSNNSTRLVLDNGDMIRVNTILNVTVDRTYILSVNATSKFTNENQLLGAYQFISLVEA